MAEYLIQDTTLDNIADAINAKTGKSASMTPAEMVTEIGNIPSGTEITDGIVVKARNANNGRPTEIDLYGSVIYNQEFRAVYHSAYDMRYWSELAKINFKSPIYDFGSGAFYGTQIEEIDADYSSVTILKADAFESAAKLRSFDFSNIIRINSGAFLGCASLAGDIYLPVCTRLNTSDTDDINAGGYVFRGCRSIKSINAPKVHAILRGTFSGCTSLESVYLPECVSIASHSSINLATFENCTSLKTVQIGSVGYGIVGMYMYPETTFRGCTQIDLTITIYTTGSYADKAVSYIRNGATNATIIIKASEATIYNGTSYAAGDTILTSEVEQTS